MNGEVVKADGSLEGIGGVDPNNARKSEVSEVSDGLAV